MTIMAGYNEHSAIGTLLVMVIWGILVTIPESKGMKSV